jgi:hypothetical protein
MADTAVESAPSSSSGASSSGNITSGTASEAMIRAATAASEPAATGDTSTQGGVRTPEATGATDQPAPTGQPTAKGTRGPTLTLEAHERVLRNAREQTAQLERQYAWAKEFKPEQAADIKVALQLLADIRKDPRAFYQELSGYVQPRQPQPEQQTSTGFPDPELVSEDGKLKTYSDRQIHEIANSIRQQVMQELDPLIKFQQQTTTEREGAAIRQASRQQAQSVLETAKTLPHFMLQDAQGKTVYNPAILANLKAIPPETVEQVGAVGALYMAYNKYLSEAVFPNIQATAQQEVRDSFAKKAATSRGSAHPTDQGGEAKVPELKGPEQLARHMERLAATMTQ